MVRKTQADQNAGKLALGLVRKTQADHASEAQSHDVDRFSQGVEEMDVALAGNVENVKRVASASGSLREQARTLSAAMSAFIVERG
ncbi:hypothetical protein [Burkholderia gladioli]|uniref:hypothetical protein n=1 Tax=Burkholderia gladioli TaxID=28095 RepID=UPI001FC85517|nr:hypothetical protein [Burkholderia gladioli]